MRKFILASLAVFATVGLAVGAVTLPNKIPVTGPGLIPGSTINRIIDAVKELQTNSTTPVNGVGTGYKIARGETALDGTNPTPAATGLTTIVACTTTIKLATSPGVSTSVVTYGVSDGTLNLYGWKVTAVDDATLVASDGTQTIGWVCVGT